MNPPEYVRTYIATNHMYMHFVCACIQVLLFLFVATHAKNIIYIYTVIYRYLQLLWKQNPYLDLVRTCDEIIHALT